MALQVDASGVTIIHMWSCDKCFRKGMVDGNTDDVKASTNTKLAY